MDLGKIASDVFRMVADPDGMLAASAKAAIEKAKKDPNKSRAAIIIAKNEKILRDIKQKKG